MSVRVDKPAGAAHGELLCDVEDGVGQTFLQGLLVLLLDGVMPAEHLVVVDGLVELDHWLALEGGEKKKRIQTLQAGY